MNLPAQSFVFSTDAAFARVRDDFSLHHAGYAADVDRLFFAWPTLEALVARSSYFVSPAYPCDGMRSLMVEALHAGVLASARKAATESFQDFVLAFLNTLSIGFSSRDIFGLTEGGEEQRWKMYDPPICQWATNYDRIVVADQKPSAAIIGANLLLLAGRLLSADEMTLLPDLLPDPDTGLPKKRARRTALASS